MDQLKYKQTQRGRGGGGRNRGTDTHTHTRTDRGNGTGPPRAHPRGRGSAGRGRGSAGPRCLLRSVATRGGGGGLWVGLGGAACRAGRSPPLFGHPRSTRPRGFRASPTPPLVYVSVCVPPLPRPGRIQAGIARSGER